MIPARTLEAPPATRRPLHPLVVVGLGLVVGLLLARLARR
jgi:hypothetical protein